MLLWVRQGRATDRRYGVAGARFTKFVERRNPIVLSNTAKAGLVRTNVPVNIYPRD